MMVSPYSVYEELKTKSNEEIVKEIRRFQRKISQLKNLLETHNVDEPFEHPFPDVQISCYRDYLVEAKRLLRERGVEYTPTKAEQRALEFDERLSQVIAIHVIRSGFFIGCKQYCITCGDQFQTVTYKNKSIIDNTPYSWIIDLDKESFVSELQKLHIGEWKRNYYMYALDGEQWKIEFVFHDGTKRTFKGSNAYPYNFDNLMDLIGISREDTDDEEDSPQLPTEEEFAKLPEEEQQKVLEEWFASLTPEEQQAYLDSLSNFPKDKK